MADQFAAFRKSPTGFIAKASKRLTAHLIQGPRVKPKYALCFVCQIQVQSSWKPLITIRLNSSMDADGLEKLFQEIKDLGEDTKYGQLDKFSAILKTEWPRHNPGVYHRYLGHDYFYYDELGCMHQTNLMWDFL